MNNDLNANEPRAGHQSDEIAAMSPGERFQLMFDVPETVPKWKELAEIHGIATKPVVRLNDDDEEEDEIESRIHWFGGMQFATGRNEKEAVITLIHRLKLTGWETVSIN